MAAPSVSIGCLACHGQFFAASLPFHQKTCFQRNSLVLVPCKKCKTCVRAGDFHVHATSCDGEVWPLELELSQCDIGHPTVVDTNSSMELNLPEEDGRVRCKSCERAFYQDRISKHQSVCREEPISMKKAYLAGSTGEQPARRQTTPTRRSLASRIQEMNRERNNGSEWSNGALQSTLG